MFRIKICGLKTPEDARLAADAGADAIGLNFYRPSPRSVTPAQAAEIAANLAANVERVGVFVDHSVEALLDIVEAAGLTAIQLHGDDSAEKAAAVLNGTKRQVYLAMRCREPGLASVAERLAQIQRLSRLPDAVLLDAYQPGSFGGTGQKLDWNLVREQRGLLGGVPLILAGGLHPQNVAAAISQAQPDAVDVASGVESSPGNKDAALVRAFIAAAKAAFGAQI